MDAAPKVVPQELVESLQQESETFLRSVMEVVNLAPDGEWIADSEEQVRELSAEFRQRVCQTAVQKRIDAAEAAFPPSAGNDDRSGHEAGGQKAASQ